MPYDPTSDADIQAATQLARQLNAIPKDMRGQSVSSRPTSVSEDVGNWVQNQQAGVWGKQSDFPKRMGAAAETVAGLVPGTAEDQVATNLQRGEYSDAAMNALGTIPGGALAGKAVGAIGSKLAMAFAPKVEKIIAGAGFYSKAARAAEAIPVERMDTGQALAALVKAGVSPEELKWTGLADRLSQPGKITKQELAQHIQNNDVNISEVKSGKSLARYNLEQDEEASLEMGEPIFNVEDLDGNFIAKGGYNEVQKFVDESNLAVDSSNPYKFEEHSLPGGEDYNETRLSLSDGDQTNPRFQSTHWSEPDVVVHIRTNKFKSWLGKIFNLDELQSDWGQKGREKGFESLTGNKEPGISRAPYVESTGKWTDLGLKKALMQAAESDADFFTITPGQIHVDRYDLDKNVKAIYSKKNEDGTYTLDAEHDGYTKSVSEKSLTYDQMVKKIGKETADKIANEEGSQINFGVEGDPSDYWQKVKTPGLKLGGQGMRDYYNNIVPKQLSEILRKATKEKPRFETINIPTADGDLPALGFRLTPEIKAAIKEFSHFNRGGKVSDDITNALRIARQGTK